MLFSLLVTKADLRSEGERVLALDFGDRQRNYFFVSLKIRATGAPALGAAPLSICETLAVHLQAFGAFAGTFFSLVRDAV